MANRTASYASTVHGTNPQYLIEKIIRTRIQESKYWKEHCTLLNSALVLEKAVDDLRYIGGVFGGNVKPTPFLCLVLKLLQIQPQKEIIDLYLSQPDFKYLRALGAFYMRMVGTPAEVHKKLEPLLRDYRKLRTVDRMHRFSVIYMDDYIDNLLHEDRVFDVILPRMTKRSVLEELGDLEPYKSELEEQNLIPKELIKEKIEQSLRDGKHQERRDHEPRGDRDDNRHGDRGDRRHGDRHEVSRSSRHDVSRSSRRSPSRERREYDRRHDSRRSHYDRSSSRRSSRSPPHSRYRDEGGSSKHQGPLYKGLSIDNENSIRAKLGLKPLR